MKPKLVEEEITKTRADKNEIGTKNNIEKINETKSWFFEKINKIEKPLDSLMVRKRRLK